jgi:FkbM family methyltransferase
LAVPGSHGKAININIKYILRRLSFSFELKGKFSKIKYFIQELISLSTRIRPNGIQQVTWKGPKGNLVLNYYDSLVVFRAEILDDHLYDIELTNKNDPIILDIGSNQGHSVLFFKYNYPNAKIYAYEPVKQSFDILVKNIKDNKLNNCILINAGVFDKNITHNIYHIPGNAGLGDTISTLCTKGCEVEEIQLFNIDNDFKKIDLLKFDAEGSEYPVLKHCNFWKKADKIIIEFHDQFKESFGFKYINFIKLIENAGFKLDKKTDSYPIYVCYFSKQKGL